jgi:hypothetical protein
MEKVMGIVAMPLYNGACAFRRRFSLIIRAFEDPTGVSKATVWGPSRASSPRNVRIYAYPMTSADLCEWLNTASASAWE